MVEILGRQPFTRLWSLQPPKRRILHGRWHGMHRRVLLPGKQVGLIFEFYGIRDSA
jgi:hypothetical protein